MRKRGIAMWCVVIVSTLMFVNAWRSSHATWNMSYLYGSYDYISLVERTKNALNEVSPSYFDLDSNGNLQLNTVDTKLVSAMHEKGITVVPFLSNHWDRAKGRKALQNKEKLVTQIVNAVKKYGLDGVNVDIENLTEGDREAYTELVQMLKNQLPTGKSLSVAVAANPYYLNTGWQGSYDYAALGKIADYLMVMAYDEHYEGGEAGPVASIHFVEGAIQYALESVPSHKIVLGVPFYGRYWENRTRRGRLWHSYDQDRRTIAKI